MWLEASVSTRRRSDRRACAKLKPKANGAGSALGPQECLKRVREIVGGMAVILSQLGGYMEEEDWRREAPLLRRERSVVSTW